MKCLEKARNNNEKSCNSQQLFNSNVENMKVSINNTNVNDQQLELHYYKHDETFKLIHWQIILTICVKYV